MFSPPGSRTMQMSWSHNSQGIDNSHTCALDLGLSCNPNVGPSLVTIGQWTKVEAYLKASTTATSRDGILRWWINGVLSGNYTNINYAQNGLNAWQWNNTWDGAQDMGVSNTVDWEHWLDHVHISIPNGGTSTDSPLDRPQPQHYVAYQFPSSASCGAEPFLYHTGKWLASGGRDTRP